MAEAMKRNVVHFRAARLIAREVVALQQNAFEYRVIGVHPSVDISDDSGTAHVERILRFGKADDLSRRLVHIAV